MSEDNMEKDSEIERTACSNSLVLDGEKIRFCENNVIDFVLEGFPFPIQNDSAQYKTFVRKQYSFRNQTHSVYFNGCIIVSCMYYCNLHQASYSIVSRTWGVLGASGKVASRSSSSSVPVLSSANLLLVGAHRLFLFQGEPPVHAIPGQQSP